MSIIDQYERHIREANECYLKAKSEGLQTMAEYWLTRKQAFEEALTIMRQALVIA
jgi:hypothetical protein